MPSAPNQVGYLYSFPSSSLTVEPFSAVVADRDCFGSHLSQLNWWTKSFPDFLVAPPWLLSPSAVKPVRDWSVCHLSQWPSWGGQFYGRGSPSLIAELFSASCLLATGMFAISRWLYWETKSFSPFRLFQYWPAELSAFDSDRDWALCHLSVGVLDNRLFSVSNLGEVFSNPQSIFSGTVATSFARVGFIPWNGKRSSKIPSCLVPLTFSFRVAGLLYISCDHLWSIYFLTWLSKKVLILAMKLQNCRDEKLFVFYQQLFFFFFVTFPFNLLLASCDGFRNSFSFDYSNSVKCYLSGQAYYIYSTWNILLILTSNCLLPWFFRIFFQLT